MEPGLPFVLCWAALAVGGAVLWWRSASGSRWAGIAMACLCLALGGLVGEGVVAWRDQKLRGELLLRSRHLAAGLDRADLAAHRNRPEDVGQPWFDRIKARLSEARERDPEVKYAYLLEWQDGRLYFPNDDDRIDAPDYEPPGLVYAEAPAEMRQAVAAGSPFTLGPYSDRWGEFITVGVPIELAQGRRMALALDVLAKHWRGELWLWRTWPIALGLALGGLAMLFMSRGRALAATRQAVIVANEANRAKDAYLATVSHDLRSPLSGIIGLTGLLADSELTQQQREFVQLAHNSGQQLLSLVNELLDYARIEAGELAFDRVHCSVRELVEDAVALLAPLATSKGVELNAVVERSVPAAMLGDPDRIRQILHNLIGNAVKFTDDGEVVVRVSVQPEPGTDRLGVSCAVRDTGVGIDAATQATLFKPFIQGGEARQRRGGTGLGLCIAQRIARGMGGDITLQSAPKAGSTFTATFVLDPDPQPPEVEGVMPLRRGARVLIGVEHATLRTSICEQVASLGLEPLAAADQGEIARLAGATPIPAAVLIDAAWAREVASGLTAIGIPVALLAARSAGGTQMLAMRRMPVLLRPVRRDGLLNLLRNLWGTRASSSRSFPPASPEMEPGLPRSGPAGAKPEEALDYTPSAASAGAPAPAAPAPHGAPAAHVVRVVRAAAAAPPAAPPAAAMAVLAGGLQGGLRSGIDALREAASRGDLSTVQRAAQGLRSAAEPMRLSELVETCLALETAAITGDRGGVQTIAGTLEDVRRRTQQQISQLRRDASLR